MLALTAHASLSLVGVAPVLAVAALGALLAAALVAARRRLGSRGPSTRHAVALGAGIVVLGVALSPLLDAERLLSTHMLQHALLVGVAAPLLALGTPVVLLLCLVPASTRARVHRLRRRIEPRGERALWIALALHAGVVTAWHVPWLYERAIAPGALHVLEHALFLGPALVLWWLLLGGGTPVAVSTTRVAVLVLVALHGAVLGALLAFSPTPWYETYARGADPVADQQLAGLVMWSVGSIAPVVAAFVLVARWLERPHARDPVPAARLAPPRP